MRATQPRARLHRFWEAPAFSIGDRQYDGLDVALSAMVRGVWAAFDRRLAEGIACTRRAQSERALPSAEALEEAATAFRYDRDLLAATDVSDWLAHVEISVDDWMAYLARDLLRQRWHDSLGQTLDGYPPAPHDLTAAAFAEGACSGLFDDFADTLAARAALAADATAGATVVAVEAVTTVAQRHAHWLSDRPSDEVLTRVERIMTIEARFSAAIADVLASAPLGDIVAQHRLQWQQVELDTLRFPSESAAREAVLCVTLDRLSVHDVAALSRRTAERTLHFAEELDADRRDLILSVAPGAVLGPHAVNGHFEVSALVRRISPALTDPRIVDRAQRAVIERTLRRVARDRVVRHARG